MVHQTCKQCHSDFVGPSTNIGENLCPGCYADIHAKCIGQLSTIHQTISGARMDIESALETLRDIEDLVSDY